jgi:hypothetical protein
MLERLCAIPRRLQPWLTEGEMPLAHVAALTACFLPLHFAFFQLATLPEGAYFSENFLIDAARFPRSGCLLALVALNCVATWRHSRWETLEPGRTLRCFVGFLAVVLAWIFSAYDYNHFFGHDHLSARLGVAALACGVWFHPAFVAPFLAVTLLVAHQFAHPLGQYIWVDKLILFDILVLFQAWLWLRIRFEIHPRVFLGVALCMQAANYFVPGCAKLVMGWLSIEQLDHLFIASYQNGWCRFLSEDRALAIAEWLRALNFPLIAGVLLLELAAIAIFVGRRACLALLIAFSVLHVAIYFTAGLLFWEWMLLNAAFTAVLLAADWEWTEPLFSRRFRWFSIAAILCSPVCFRPVLLAWYDTGLHTSYFLEMVDDAGGTRRLPARCMSPYDVVFAQQRLHYMDPGLYLVDTHGTTGSREVALKLSRARTPGDIRALRIEAGASSYDPVRVAAFDRFLLRYFQSWNATRRKPIGPAWLVPPHHFHASDGEPTLTVEDEVRTVRVVQVRTFYRPRKIETLGTAVLREVAIY